MRSLLKHKKIQYIFFLLSDFPYLSICHRPQIHTTHEYDDSIAFLVTLENIKYILVLY